MYFTKKKGILKIFNSNASKEELIFPSYNHIIIDDKIYIPTNDFTMPETIYLSKETSCYLSFNVIVSGLIAKEKGYFPNPMHESATIKINSIEYEIQ